jgi:hypothetical protein
VRQSLKQSLADTIAGDHVGFRYPKGSIVLCTACAAPIAILEQGIALGDKAGRMAQAFAPLRLQDLETLGAREDVDAGVRAFVRSLTPEQKKAHVDRLHRFRTGDPAICPCCHQGFMQVLSVEKSEALDRAYVLELVTIPPHGQKVVAVRGQQIGADKGWLHPGATLIH